MLVWLCFAVPMVVLLGITVPFFIQDKYYYSVDEDKHSKFARKYHNFGESTAGGVCFIIALIFVFIVVMMSLITGINAAVNAADETPRFKDQYASAHYALYGTDDCSKYCYEHNHLDRDTLILKGPNWDDKKLSELEDHHTCFSCMVTLVDKAVDLDAKITKNKDKCDSIWIGWFYNPGIGHYNKLLK